MSWHTRLLSPMIQMMPCHPMLHFVANNVRHPSHTQLFCREGHYIFTTAACAMDASGQLENHADHWEALDPLPWDLQRDVLRRIQFSARATCTAFRLHHDEGCQTLNMRWPAHVSFGSNLPDSLHVQRLLVRLPQLRALNAAWCPPGFLSILALPYLTSLDLRESCYLESVQPLAACTALLTLNLADCTSITNVNALRLCDRLTALVLRNMENINNLGMLGTCPSLSALDLTGCQQLVDLTFLASCSGSRV